MKDSYLKWFEKEKEMKKLFLVLFVGLLSLNILFACGGMSPQPAPGDFDTNVPSLPDGTNITADNTNVSNDNICPIHDNAKPCDICNGTVENVTSVGDLSSDLPATQNSTNDGQFVEIIL